MPWFIVYLSVRLLYRILIYLTKNPDVSMTFISLALKMRYYNLPLCQNGKSNNNETK